ncbi:polysaccharide lyase, partial [Candidatus Kaiserbacteria bacterium]|nr:polysaccharide lyase [Candidatus Kaiserbacteria bacterium]
WVEQTLNNLKARYVRIIVKGNSANGNTQAREIELYSAEGTDVSTTNANKATSNNSTNNQSSNTVTTGNRDNSLVDFFEDFEDGKLSDSFSCSGNCPTVSTEQALNGRYAMRSQVTSSMSNQKRAEVVPKSSTGVRSMEFEKDYWFGFSVYIPTNWTTPPGFEIPFQIHEPSGGTQPTLALYTGSGTWKVKTEGQGFGKDEKFLNKVSDDKGKWVDFVVQYRPSYKGTGVAKVWKDGSLVYSRTGNTAGNYVGGTYAKFGIYKGNLEDNNVLYHDDIRITANPKAGYKDVAP